MKIRDGFVSNSSSSSFIIAFANKPETVEEMKKILFGDEELFDSPYPDFHTKVVERYPTELVAKTVLDDITGQKPMTHADIVREMTCGYVDGEPDVDDFRNGGKWSDIDWDAYDIANREHASNKADAFVKAIGDKQVYVVEYSDNSGKYFCALEHGDVFRNIEHFRVSKH